MHRAMDMAVTAMMMAVVMATMAFKAMMVVVVMAMMAVVMATLTLVAWIFSLMQNFCCGFSPF